MLQNLFHSFSSITPLEIIVFLIPFVLAVWIDLSAHKRKGHQDVSMWDAVMWFGIWCACSLGFAGFIWWDRGGEAAGGFLTGWMLEKALAIDNLFAFFLIFKSFGLVTKENQHFQHKILYWGVLGAILGRIVFLGAGAMIVNISNYILILFACIILWTVYKMWTSDDGDEEVDYTNHWSVNMVKRFSKVNASIASGGFFHQGVTPLFLCLVCIETCDIVFAFDSMPTIIAVVRDPYLMITASLWAAAGLRSLYFLLVAAQNKFWALEKAVMCLLVFIAAKLILNAFEFHISNLISLSIVALILATGVIYSLVVKEPQEKLPDTSVLNENN